MCIRRSVARGNLGHPLKCQFQVNNESFFSNFKKISKFLHLTGYPVFLFFKSGDPNKRPLLRLCLVKNWEEAEAEQWEGAAWAECSAYVHTTHGAVRTRQTHTLIQKDLNDTCILRQRQSESSRRDISHTERISHEAVFLTVIYMCKWRGKGQKTKLMTATSSNKECGQKVLELWLCCLIFLNKKLLYSLFN